MEPEFWHQRWAAGQIGFHQDRTSPMLAAHWDACAVPPDARVFVPLCGKSLDMHWLAARGHRVLGVELSQAAIDAFFAEAGLVPDVHESARGLHHVAGAIEIITGDVFALDAAALAGCAGVFDRAALIALPGPLRTRYLAEVYGALPPGCRGLLVTLEFPQHQKAGPPFAVAHDEIRTGLSTRWQVDLLERRDILANEPSFRDAGVTALATAAWRLSRD